MSDPTLLYQTGIEALRMGQFAEAASLSEEAVTQFPEEGRLWELLGIACCRSGQTARGLEALETASLLKPLDPAARFCLAECYAAIGKPELAVFVYQQLAESDLTPLALMPRIASRLGQLNQFAEALDVCRSIVRRDDTRHEAHFGISYYLRRLGRPVEQVAEAVGRAHELAPEVSLYRIVLAGLWHEMGRTADACEILRGVPLDTIDCPAALRRMMVVFRAARDSSRSEACCRRLQQFETE